MSLSGDRHVRRVAAALGAMGVLTLVAACGGSEDPSGAARAEQTAPTSLDPEGHDRLTDDVRDGANAGLLCSIRFEGPNAVTGPEELANAYAYCAGD